MIWHTMAAVVAVLISQYFWASYSQIETIPYSQFDQLLSEGKLAEATVGADSVEVLSGALRRPTNSKRGSSNVTGARAVPVAAGTAPLNPYPRPAARRCRRRLRY
jgi:hypothetical protein